QRILLIFEVLLDFFFTFLPLLSHSLIKQIFIKKPGNAIVTATMSIDNEKYLADVHVRAGEYSSDTIFDYWHGYVATRVFSRNACFILKIEKDSIPELREIGRLAFEKQTLKKIYSPNNLWVQYDTGKSVFANVKEWLLYGKAIENLCRGLPIYKLVKTEGKEQEQNVNLPLQAASEHFSILPT
uniref:Gastrokine-2 n=1 Tax=Apteryx owenii TaxID=8824 RepID=A0A8B9QC69_APTOW